jgi:uncharacterized repeat protein (TIGR01451 family)
MNKKLLPVLVLSFLVVTVLLGCGQQPSTGETPTAPSTPESAVPSTPSPPTPSELTMLSITEGDVFLMKSGTETWVEAEVGMTLEIGDTIKAGDDSRAVITFFEGSTIELEASTEIKVVELNIAADTGSTAISLGQEIGRTISRVEKLTDPASRYEIETPDAAAVIRGTIVIVDAREGETMVGCQNGTVWGSPRGVDVEVEILEGWQCTFARGQPPGDLVPLISPAEEDEDWWGGGGGGGGTRHIAAIAMAKTADCATVHEGDAIGYTYNVTNAGNALLYDVSVTDDKVSLVTYQGGDSNHDGSLDTRETWVFTASYTVGPDDASPLVNIATATASGRGALQRTVSTQASASVTVLKPAIAITKTAEPTQVYAGDEITYTYNVTNPGNTPLYNVSVSDNITSPVTYQSGDNGDNKLDVGETWTFIANYTASGDEPSPLVNTATASGIDDLSQNVTAQASASVTVLPYSIRIELTWDTDDTDFDGHFIRPGGEMWNIPDDCYYRNMNPDWGLTGVGEDNPSLDQDLTGGYGPEYTTLKVPYDVGLYQYKVHYYSDHEHGPSTATVKIWINGIKVAEYSEEMSSRQTWDCASIEWPSGYVAPASAGWTPSSPEVEK